jgi:hypothetical protein
MSNENENTIPNDDAAMGDVQKLLNSLPDVVDDTRGGAAPDAETEESGISGEEVEVEFDESGGFKVFEKEEEAEVQKTAAGKKEVSERPEREKRRRDPQARINQVTGKMKEAEESARQARLELLEERRQRFEGMDFQYKQGIIIAEQQEKEAIRALVEAKENGDTKAEIEAQQRMIEAQTHKNEFTKARIQVKQEADALKSRVAAEVSEIRPAPAASNNVANKAAWQAQNEWFGADAEMTADVEAYATKMNQNLIKNGRQDLIGSAEYFAAIDKYVEQNYEEDDGDEEEVAPVQKSTRPKTASASSSATNSGKKVNSDPNKITLPREQLEAFKSIEFSLTHDGKGKPLKTRTEKLRYYASIYQDDVKNDRGAMFKANMAGRK